MQENKRPQRARSATYEKGHARIEAILDAASEVLITKGYKKLTLRQIALRAGIKVGNLTYYYSTKEALLQDLLVKILREYLAEIDKMPRLAKKHGNCVFYDDGEGLCTAYGTRPTICRRFPFEVEYKKKSQKPFAITFARLPPKRLSLRSST